MTNAEIAAIGQYIDEYPKGWGYDSVINALEQGDPEGDVYLCEYYDHLQPQTVAVLMDSFVETLNELFKDCL